MAYLGKTLRGIGSTMVMTMFFALVFGPPALVVATEVENLHLGVTKDCGDGKTYTKLGPKWGSFPVSYSVTPASGANADAIRRGFVTWDAEEHPAGAFYTEQSGSGQNIDVSFGPIDGSGGTLAQTSYSYNRFTKKFIEVNIVFDSAESWANYAGLSCSSQGSGVDVEAVAVHEIGHGNGIGHSSSSTALSLYPFYGSGATHQRTLATGDAKGLDALY